MFHNIVCENLALTSAFPSKLRFEDLSDVLDKQAPLLTSAFTNESAVRGMSVTFIAWTVLVQSDWPNSTLSPVAHGDIALSITCTQMYKITFPGTSNMQTGVKIFIKHNTL